MTHYLQCVSLPSSLGVFLLSQLGREVHLPDVPFHITKWKIGFTRGAARFQTSEHINFFFSGKKAWRLIQHGQIFSCGECLEGDLSVSFLFVWLPICNLNQWLPAKKASSSIITLEPVCATAKNPNGEHKNLTSCFCKNGKRRSFFYCRSNQPPIVRDFMVCFVQPLSWMTRTGPE